MLLLVLLLKIGGAGTAGLCGVFLVGGKEIGNGGAG
jgi:hypothetical protein